MNINPQSGSHSTTSRDTSNMTSSTGQSSSSSPKALPPLFIYMEANDWLRATERARRHPREVKAWANIRSKSDKVGDGSTISSAKRLALHHACFKLRNAVNSPVPMTPQGAPLPDPFIEVCKLILVLVQVHPEAAGLRESRHGCLPLHLAAFAACTLPPSKPAHPGIPASESPRNLKVVAQAGCLPRPGALTSGLRSVSESTAESVSSSMTNGMDEEHVAGTQTDKHYQATTKKSTHSRGGSVCTVESSGSTTPIKPTVSVSMGNNIFVSEKREEWAVRVLNALLDAYPRGIRMDSEGGRLPLHTACAGRATPRVVSTLITAYPAAARHRNKDGFLPLHLSAHWGISHPNVAVALLKAYPDATFGRNRWERTPLEEALCMAGENGRPHQAALVRALRKHPSYWTRPMDFMEETSPRKGSKQIVDTDETLASFDDDSTEGDYRGFAENTGTKGRLTVFGRGKNGAVEAISPVTLGLQTLIKNQQWEVVLARLEMNPEDAEQELVVTTRGGFTSTTGFTPLHYACERKPPIAVVDALISACPQAVSTRAMPGGALPLHAACTWHASVEVVSALLMANRNSCKTADELGNLALHSACFSGTHTHVVECLLRSYPKATLARNHQGSLPEEITQRLKHDNKRSIVALLGLCKEEVLSKREKKHRRNRSDGYLSHISEVENPQNGAGNEDLMWV
eukprot:Nitzschia sp. Nitz4//scaffold58_size112336//89721//91866//NITZ4_004046-RA/size112336-augustus-gene-0.13-mRNA-1//1//CDS//3329555028//3553//frame0